MVLTHQSKVLTRLLTHSVCTIVEMMWCRMEVMPYRLRYVNDACLLSQRFLSVVQYTTGCVLCYKPGMWIMSSGCYLNFSPVTLCLHFMCHIQLFNASLFYEVGDTQALLMYVGQPIPYYLGQRICY